MLIEASPWQTGKTSIRATKKRKGKNSSASDGVAHCVSFIPPARRNRKRQDDASSSDYAPMFSITTEHLVSVVEHSEEQNSFQESSTIQFASRPGSLSSFFPATNGEGSLPRNPVLIEPKTGLAYSLQSNSTRLSAWKYMEANGPDDTSACGINLKSPALSLASMPSQRATVFGTCKDGSVFVARVDFRKNELQSIDVSYIRNPSAKTTGVHVGTGAEFQETPQQQRKRKSNVDGQSILFVYQCFFDNNKVHFNRYNVLENEMDKAEVVTSCLTPRLRNGESIVGDPTVKFHGSASGCKCALLFSSKNEKKAYHRAVGVDLQTGCLMGTPVSPPGVIAACELLGGSLLAAPTSDAVLVCDLASGTPVTKLELPSDLMSTSSDSWTLSSDTKSSTLVVVYVDKTNHLSFAASRISLEQGSAHVGKVSLADKLASSYYVPRSGDEPKHSLPCLDKVTSADTSIDQDESIISKIVGTLAEGVDSVLSNKKSSSGALWQTFSQCCDDLADGLGLVSSHSTIHNPQDGENQSAKKSSKRNGVHSSEETKKRKSTKMDKFPQQFINSAFGLIVKVLLSKDAIPVVRADAAKIMLRLLKSKKVLSRLHFDSDDGTILRALLQSLEPAGSRKSCRLPPYHFAHCLLSSCIDVSEMQMAILIDYMLGRAKASAVARSVIELKICQSDHPCFALATKYLEEAKATNDDGFSETGDRVIMSCTTFLVHRMMCYSDCNESILRLALTENLTHASETAVLLARILIHLLEHPTFHDERPARLHAKSILVTCHWVSALVDAYYDELSGAFLDKTSRQSLLDKLRFTVKKTTSASESILSLRKDLLLGQELATTKEETTKQCKKIHSIVKNDPRLRGADIPDYSIEKLCF